MKVLYASLGVLLVVAQAQVPARAEWRVAGAFGAAFTRGSDLSISQGASRFTVDSVDWSERPFQPAIHYDVRVEYFLPKHPMWGLFLDLNHMKIHAQTGDVRHIHGVIDGIPVDTEAEMRTVADRFNVAHGLNFVGLGAMHRWRHGRDERYANGRVQPYVGLSVGPVINHPDSNVLGQDQYGPFVANRRWGGQIMAGTHYAISPSWGFFTEAKYTHVDDRVPIGGGHASMRVDSFHTNAGMTYTF